MSSPVPKFSGINLSSSGPLSQYMGNNSISKMARTYRQTPAQRRGDIKKGPSKYRATDKYAQRKQINDLKSQIDVLRSQSTKVIKLGSAENSLSISNPFRAIELTDLGKLKRIFDDDLTKYESRAVSCFKETM